MANAMLAAYAASIRSYLACIAIAECAVLPYNIGNSCWGAVNLSDNDDVEQVLYFHTLYQNRAGNHARRRTSGAVFNGLHGI